MGNRGSTQLRLPAALLAAALLPACAIFKGELPEAPSQLISEEIPADWVVPDGVAPFAQGWIDDFNDPQLDALIQEVWTHNSTLLGAIRRRDASAARSHLDKVASIPRVDLQAQAGRQKQINDFVANSAFIPEQSYISRLRIGLGVSWELDVWGRAQNTSQAAMGEVWAASLDVEAAKFSLAAQTASLWFGLIAAEQRMRISLQTLANHDANVEFARQRYRDGLISSAELRAALSEQTAAQIENVSLRLDRDRTARQLEVLLGRYPSAELVGAEQLPALPEALDAGVPSQMLERRPDVQSAALRVIASDQRLLAAKKTLLPQFSISASGASQSAYRDLLFTEDSFVWSIGGGLLQPLFDSGQIKAGIRSQRALMFESIHRYRDTVYNAFREVEDGLAADAALREQHGYMQTALELADQGRQAAEERMADGSVDGMVYLAAERGLLTTRARLLDIELAALNNRVALMLALGGSPEAPPPPASAEPQASEPDANAAAESAADTDEISS